MDEEMSDSSSLNSDIEEGDVEESEEEVEEKANEDQDNEEEGEEEEDEDEEEQTHQTALRQQLKDLSFEELEALKQKMGLKEFNEAMFGSKKKVAKKPVPLKNNKKGIKKKGDDDKPLEMSSKRRVPKLRQVVDVPKSTKRDPRFDKSCGEFSDTYWNKDYSFLRDMQKDEAAVMKTNIKNEGDRQKQKEMRRFIQRVSDKEKAVAAKQKAAEKQKQDKEENRKRIAEGKQPFYMKQSTKKMMELAEKYEELKTSGRLEKYMKKKRQRNAKRDRKSLKQ